MAQRRNVGEHRVVAMERRKKVRMIAPESR
jgi:hypothetical protein